MDTKELLKKVRKIEIKTKGLSKNIFSGEYHSAFKGRGMSFSEVRDYQYGDDIRNIDWNVTARTGEPHVKIYEEERELTLMLIIDFSGSSFFGSRNQLKSQLATEIAAILAFSAMNNNDKVGAIFFAKNVELYLPPKKGKKHILRIIRELININPKSKETNLKSALEFFNNVNKKRAICFILSDFMTDQYDIPLKVASKRHDIVGIHISDKIEGSIPNVGFIKIKDPEIGIVKQIDTSNKDLMQLYSNTFENQILKTKQLFRSSGADILQLYTGSSYITELLSFFKRRTK